MSEQASRRVWFIRPGEGSGLWSEFEAGRIIGIGYSLEKSRADITTLDRSGITEVLRTVKPDETHEAVRSMAGQVWRFARVLSVGDVVVLPRDAARMVAVGTVVGPCRRGLSVRAWVRNVRWIDTAVRVDDPELRKSLNSQKTVWEPRAPAALEALSALLEPILPGQANLDSATSSDASWATGRSTVSWSVRTLAADVAAAASVAAPTRLTRAAVHSMIRSVLSTRGGPDELPDARSVFAWLLEDLGDPLDGAFDWRDDRPTSAGWRKTRRLLRGEPFTFILNLADNEASREYADVLGESYGFDSQVSGHRALVDAGAGSRVLFYGTRNAEAVPQMAVFGDGRVESIAETAHDEASGKTWYRAAIDDYRWFPHLVRVDTFEVDGWNHQHGITEVTFDTFREAIRRGTGSDVVAHLGSDGILRSIGGRGARLPRIDVAVPPDLTLSIPDNLPEPAALRDPSAPPNENDNDAVSPGGRATSPRERQENKVIEGRAVHFACTLLERDGWKLVADRQRDGVGYDFEYQKGSRMLHVEVKGIRGDKLRFNMTGKEWRRAAEDPDFVVVAVTCALDDDPVPNLLTRDDLARAEARLVEVRLSLPD